MNKTADILGIKCPVCDMPKGHYCKRERGSAGFGFPSTTHRARVEKAQHDAPTPEPRPAPEPETECPWCNKDYVDGKVTCACYGFGPKG